MSQGAGSVGSVTLPHQRSGPPQRIFLNIQVIFLHFSRKTTCGLKPGLWGLMGPLEAEDVKRVGLKF